MPSSTSGADAGAAAALPIALPRWQRRAIYVSVALLTASGIAWLVAAGPFGGDADAEALSSTARQAAAWSLRVHGVLAYATLVVAGSVLPSHLRPAWQRHRNRRSGATLATLLLLLAGTGLWLYYGSGGGRGAVSIAHWALGLVLPGWLLVHRARGLASRRSG